MDTELNNHNNTNFDLKKIEVTNVFDRNFRSEKKIILNEGGARSSKSYSICQLMVQRFINRENYKLLITRKTLPSLKLTAYKEFENMLINYGYMPKCQHNKTMRVITLGSKEAIFTSVDDPIKIRSTEFNDIWMEEANEFTYTDYIVLKTRLSAKKDPGTINQMFLSFNPTDEHGYINQKLRYDKDVEVIKSSYKDNPFLSDEYIELLEGLKEQDENFYKIYALGEYGQLSGIIYKPYETRDFPDTFDEVIYGLDFGWNVPTALVRIGIKENEYYLQELLYETQMTNGQLIDKLNEFKISASDEIYCDSQEPNRIEEICQAGYNAMASDKSVNDGIDFVKRQKLFTRPENVNLNMEAKIYCWKKDKNGNLLDAPVKYNDHLMDAKRYAIYTHSKNRGEPRMRRLG